MGKSYVAVNNNALGHTEDESRKTHATVYFAKGEPRNVEYGKVFWWKCNIWVLRTRKLPDATFFIHSILRN